MINALTQEQKNKFPEYVNRWLAIGLSTEPANHELAEKACRDAYRAAGLEEPKLIFWALSPINGAHMAAFLKEALPLILKGADVGAAKKAQVGAQVGAQVRAQVRAQVGAQVWAQVGAQVGDQVGDQVWAQVGAQVWAQVRAQVGAQVWAQVRDQVGAQVRAQVRAQVGAQVWAQVGDQVYGQHDSGWLSFYNYIGEELNIQDCQRLRPLMDLALNCGWWAPYKNIAILQEKHTICTLKNKVLHCDNGPAIAYQDGFEIYFLNGVRVHKEIVMTVAEELDLEKFVLKESNAEIRKEVIRKVGIERTFKTLGAKSVDKMDDYELVDLDLRDGRYRPFLKMVNPSTGQIHLEGVHPDCKTVKYALAWRNGLDKYIKPQIIT